MRGIAITPPDGFCRLVVVPDAAPNLASDVGYRREDAAREQVAFDFGKPELDLVEPRRIRRREMEMYVRMLQEERAHGLGLVRGEVIGDHVNLTSARLAGGDVPEEFDKRGARVPRHGLTEHLTRFRVERRQQRERAMA